MFEAKNCTGKKESNRDNQGHNFSLCAKARIKELQGLKQGSHNNDEIDANRTTYQSTRLWNYELGSDARHSRQRKHITK
eukprot:15223551-Heterocapsa_arctica.AAC.1